MTDELVADMRRRAEEADWPAPEVISGWADRIDADARRIAELEGLMKEAREMALREAAAIAEAYDAKAMRARYDIIYNKKRFDVLSVMGCENKFANILSEDIASAILARMGGSDGSA
jgi:hypothetical protein